MPHKRPKIHMYFEGADGFILLCCQSIGLIIIYKGGNNLLIRSKYFIAHGELKIGGFGGGELCDVSGS